MNKLKTAAIILGAFAGLGGASHGPGEILQGNVVPTDVFIQAWPQLTDLSGEPAMTIIPNFAVTGVLAIIFGLLVATWAVTRIDRKLGGLTLILLSIVMLLFGGGLIPPLFGIAAGLMGVLLNYRTAKPEDDHA
jgi:hypothetical protein